jgi:hypothetical protein
MISFQIEPLLIQDQNKSNNKKNKKKAKSIYEKEISILTGKRHMYSAYYQVESYFFLISSRPYFSLKFKHDLSA